MSLEEVAAIEQTIRDYFAAVGDAQFDRLKELGTGELTTLAGWQQRLSSVRNGPVPIPVLTPEATTVDGIEVVSVDQGEATANVEGQLTETYWNDKKSETSILVTDISGLVRLVRSSPWRVADYTREGRSVAKGLVTRPRGKEASQGVIVGVTGVDVRPRGTVVIAEVNNTTGLKAGGNPPKIIGSSGKTLRTVFADNLQYTEVRAHSKSTIGFFFLKGLAPSARTFRFTMTFSLGCDPVCAAIATFDFIVKLAR